MKTISPVFSNKKLNFQTISEDKENQPMVSYCKSGAKAFEQELMKPPITSHPYQ